MSKEIQWLQQAVKEFQAGRTDQAAALCEKVVGRDPHHVLALNFLALVEQQRGRHEQALSWIQRATKLSPTNAEAHRTAGSILMALGRHEEAAEATGKAATLQPDLAGVHAQLGAALTKLERGDEAMASLEKALRQEPHPNADLLNTVSAASEQRCDFIRAEEFARQALKLEPGFKPALNSLGNALFGQGRPEEAVRVFERALAIHRDDANAHYNMSLALLASGDFLRGWAEYEWRWKRPDAPVRQPEFNKPPWDGGEIRGRRLLLYTEQGFGDAIHFIRYVPLAAERGARVVLVCPAALHALARHVDGVDQLVGSGEALPSFDTHAALMSLPHLLKTTLENVPGRVPYLPTPAAETFPLTCGRGGGLKVGLVWSGGEAYRKNRIRSAPLEQFFPLLRAPGIRFFSFQCGERAGELKTLPAGLEVEDVGSRTRDFADTAAAMGQMDLVISVCTSTLHLAGALARPVWGVLAYAPCWRWMLGRADSPWYPTMRLFRQPRPGDWAGAVAQVEAALRELARGKDPSAAAAPEVRVTSPLYYAGEPGDGFGWGVCNRHLLAELSKLTEVRRLSDGDGVFEGRMLPGDLFTPLQGSDFVPCTKSRGRRNLGYAFFENELTDESVENARGFDVVFAGSSWCLDRLREKGIRHGALLIQGVDTGVFCPGPAAKEGRFVIFSGGKFELRKGQDLVLKAFSALSRKHRDMVLLTAWHNPWPATMETMRASPHIRFEMGVGQWAERMEQLYRLNGIDSGKVITIGKATPEEMARAYRMSDLGLFPNRCEGGTNLVLMEYMACGKPAIVTDATGHKDICHAGNAYLLGDLRPLAIKDDKGRVAARWVEPSLEEIIARVEYAYEHQAEAQALGKRAAEEMKQWTWGRAAGRIVSAIGNL